MQAAAGAGALGGGRQGQAGPVGRRGGFLPFSQSSHHGGFHTTTSQLLLYLHITYAAMLRWQWQCHSHSTPSGTTMPRKKRSTPPTSASLAPPPQPTQKAPHLHSERHSSGRPALCLTQVRLEGRGLLERDYTVDSYLPACLTAYIHYPPYILV